MIYMDTRGYHKNINNNKIYLDSIDTLDSTKDLMLMLTFLSHYKNSTQAPPENSL